MKKKESFSQEVLYPVFCQDLDRARLAAGRKKDATDAFKKGLRYDMGNGELQEELGAWSEKKPPVPFLDRPHPISKIVGKMLHRKGSKRR